MIKKFSVKKISRCTILLFVVFLFCLFPKKEEYTLDQTVNKEINTNYYNVYLLDKNNYLSNVKVQIESKEKEKLIDELIEILKEDSKYIDKIPNGFKPILNSDTILLNKEIKDNILILNFNEELLNVKDEEKVIESLIYTLTNIENIDYIQIKINNQKLHNLPKTGIILEENLNRNFGINKKYDVQTIKDVSKVTIYYCNKTNNNDIYYIPVTKYINSKDEKIKIIIDELTSKISYESNLMSYLNYNAKLLDYSFNDNQIDLNFNEFLYDNNKHKKVLEEVIYSISYSIKDNYNVSKINFFVNNEEIK